MPKEKVKTPHVEKGSLELTEEIIRMRAYELYIKRGCEHGHDLEDWLQAESEIIRKPARADLVRTMHKVHAA